LLAEEREFDPKAAASEDACRDKAVAAIVSWPAEHEDAGTGTRGSANSTRDRPAGPFHEDAAGGAGRNGGGIARPHFGIAEEFEHVAPSGTLAVPAGKDKTGQICALFAQNQRRRDPLVSLVTILYAEICLSLVQNPFGSAANERGTANAMMLRARPWGKGTGLSGEASA
jgi:hypothetical protein